MFDDSASHSIVFRIELAPLVSNTPACLSKICSYLERRDLDFKILDGCAILVLLYDGIISKKFN